MNSLLQETYYERYQEAKWDNGSCREMLYLN
jgi:hypothetical protein